TIGDDGAARIWNASDGRLVRVVRGHGDLVTTAVMSDDNVLVTAALDGSIRVSNDHMARWHRLLEEVRTIFTGWSRTKPAPAPEEPAPDVDPGQLPPTIAVLSPADGFTFSVNETPIRYQLRSRSGLTVDRIDVLINGQLNDASTETGSGT